MPAALRIHALQQLEQRHIRQSEFPQAVPVLTAALRDTDPKVRQAASRALAEAATPSPRDSGRPAESAR